ncbi:BON domain-containing protein [Massilia sp. DWR3-1-1]|uniref:BON domain-containing protein n=1 Tax=Massilia sp. DWR3-1-1 TaxID=2804559 RepID=UPI003CF1EE97
MQSTFKTTILATLLATAMSASYAAAPTAALNHDPATYRNVTQKAAADFKLATNACKDMSGNAKNVCMEEAKAARAHTEADAVAQYNNTSAGRAKARNAVADADFAVAKAKCQDASGAEKDSCLANAGAVHTAAIAEVKADRAVAGATPVTTAPAPAGSAAAAAVEKCAEVAGARTGCLIDNRSGAVTTLGATTTTTTTVAPMSSEKIADQGRAAAATVVEKTREVAATVAEKTRSAVARTEVAADKAEVKSAVAARKTGVVVADSVITTKVKADIFKEPELKSMAIHVETEKGVVMLSGFVDAKADADKAVTLARNIEGVTSVKSAIKVK